LKELDLSLAVLETRVAHRRRDGSIGLPALPGEGRPGQEQQ